MLQPHCRIADQVRKSHARRKLVIRVVLERKTQTKTGTQETKTGTQVTKAIGPRIGPRISPRIGPRISPQIGPQIGPRIGPRISPRIGPRITPQIAPPEMLEQIYHREHSSWHLIVKW